MQLMLLKKQRPLFAVAALILVGCEGPAGPTGPQGTQGAQGTQGPQGPAGQTRLLFQGTTGETGVVRFQLPLAAGNINNPPAITCYRAANDVNGAPTPVWLAFNLSGNGRCGIEMTPPQSATGPLTVWMDQLPRIWPVALVVIY